MGQWQVPRTQASRFISIKPQMDRVFDPGEQVGNPKIAGGVIGRVGGKKEKRFYAVGIDVGCQGFDGADRQIAVPTAGVVGEESLVDGSKTIVQV